MHLSIIIVNYNTKDLTLQCLKSVYENIPSALEVEVFLVDNASTDGSIEAINKSFPQVQLIVNESNLGFSAANNRAIKKADGKYILLLNSDTVIFPDTLSTMLDYMERHPEVGAAGCKVVLPDGRLDKACKRSFPTPSNALFHALQLHKLFPNSEKFGAYNLTYLPEDQISDVECLVGAFMMVRKTTIDEIGLLDETFFMYGEDIDWCYRIKQAGWRITYYPKTRIIHYKGSSAKKKRWSMLWEFHRAMLIYYNKHLAREKGMLVNLLVYLAIYLRYSIVVVGNLFKKG